LQHDTIPWQILGSIVRRRACNLLAVSNPWARAKVSSLERFPRGFTRIRRDFEMCKSLALIRFTEGTMQAPYSMDLRERVIAAVAGEHLDARLRSNLGSAQAL
jgi:hypothetical protein